MDDKHLSQLVTDFVQEEITDDMDLWPAIQNQAKQGSRWAISIPRTRAGRALLLVAIMLGCVAGVYAYQLVSRPADPGLTAADEAGLVTHLNQTQTTSNNITFTLEYAYADANRISIAYSAGGEWPADEAPGNFAFLDSRLTDDAGREYTSVITGGGGGGGGGGPDTPVSFSSSSFMSYDASAITDNPDSLNLHLEVDMGLSAGMGGGSGGGSGGPEATASVMPPTPEMLPPETLVFDFTVPFNRGLVMDTPQVATSGDAEISLERVVVTPSMARLNLCFDQPPIPETLQYPVAWIPVITLTVDGEETYDGLTLSFPPDNFPPDPETRCHDFFLTAGFNTPGSEWNLTVDYLRLPGSADQDAVQQALMDAGFELIPQPDGSYGVTTPQGVDYEVFWAEVESINASLDEHVPGPWSFSFTLPEA